MAEYANPDALVETDWLEEHIDDPDIRVIEVDEDTTAYEKGHIKGSVPWNWSTELRADLGRDFIDQEGLNRVKEGTAASFVDVRSPEEYRGEKLAPDHLPQEQAQVGGHIPGAANITWSKAANDDGTFRSAEELKELYEGAGVTPDREV